MQATNAISKDLPININMFLVKPRTTVKLRQHDPDYDQYRVPYLVTWNENATARVLTSEEAILQAEKNRVNNTKIRCSCECTNYCMEWSRWQT